MAVRKVVKRFNLFTVLKKLKECVGFFFFNNLIATNNGVYPYLRISTDKAWYLSHYNRNHIHSVELVKINLQQLEEILKS